ncbi:ABC transporter substrate-binding protein [Geobacter pickeringii]|uniref:ABC transporter substrate-binding protein n=1 Tax=Geobacter pickeringii TaxID=345632 RepID=A0A0B5BEL1_9BACT|nr:ABC transporter substrate binding protein [Geobacter pickeringii]AJE02970.1 ABC transporter substrate-binding protein [Geobacter pickeringii]
MKRTLYLITALLMILTGTVEAAQGILVLQGMRVAPYEEALKGIRSIAGGSIKKLILSEMEGVDIVRTVREERPAVIVAIGAEALTKVKKIKDTPIVYLMVLDPLNALTSGENITGVNLSVSPERQLTALQRVAPSLKKIGLIYNPAHTGPLVRKALAAAKGAGLELVVREAKSPREIPRLLEGMRSEIDGFWMIPDTTVVTAETVEYLLLTCLNQRIPVLTFSDKYVEMGGLLALDVEPYDLGRQAGEIVRKVLAGTAIGSIPHAVPRSTVLTINSKIARKLGITLNEEAMGRARIIR